MKRAGGGVVCLLRRRVRNLIWGFFFAFFSPTRIIFPDIPSHPRADLPCCEKCFHVTCVDNNTFIVWQDNNGSIENEELRGFLKDLLELAKKVRANDWWEDAGMMKDRTDVLRKQKVIHYTPMGLFWRQALIRASFLFSSSAPSQDYDAEDLKEFEETILQGVDYDKDGKISRKELTMILLTLAKMPPNEQ